MPFTEDTVRGLDILKQLDEPQEKVITCLYGREIFWGPYNSTKYEGEVINAAVANFGSLIRAYAGSGKTAHYTFNELADLIERSYDMDEPRNAETVRVLRLVHRRSLLKLEFKDGQAIAPF